MTFAGTGGNDGGSGDFLVDVNNFLSHCDFFPIRRDIDPDASSGDTGPTAFGIIVLEL